MKIVDCRMMVTRVHNISRSAQSIYSKSDMFVLPPMRSRPSMRRTAGSFLNEREYWIQMLNGEKTIETRLCEKTELDGPAPYTHVIFRLVKRIRGRTGAHVMSKLGGRMGPFYSARAAVDAAAQAGRRLGLREDELLKYMTRQRKIRSGPLTGTVEEVIVPVVLYLLDDIHTSRDDIYWRECEHDQAGFLPYKHTPKGSARSRRHFGYLDDRHHSSPRGAASADGSRAAAVISSAPRSAPAAAALSVPTVSVQAGAAAPGVGLRKTARGAPERRRSGSCVSRRRLGRNFVGSANACAAAASIKIPRKPGRCESAL